MSKVRKRYTKEFKLEAVRMVLERDRPVCEIAEGLGINQTMLHQWKRKYLDDAEGSFPGNGNRQPAEGLEEENLRLRKELAEVKQDREILKKAAAFFARNQS